MSSIADSVQFAGKTDVGMRRLNNQDYFVPAPASDEAEWQSRGHIFIVADGMGGQAVGELASKLAATTIVHSYRKLKSLDLASALEEAFREGNEVVHRKAKANPEFEGMGTTATALVLHEQGAFVGHVGDSRAYRIRNGVIEQLSCDHSLAWELARAKQISDEQAGAIVPKNVITRSLGPEEKVLVDIEGPYEVREGDIFVLCSDGLSGQVQPEEIAVIASTLPPDEAAERLVDLANLRGGSDNITVLIVRANRALGRQTHSLARRLKDALVRYVLSYLLEPRSLRRGGELAIIGGVVGMIGGVLFRRFGISGWHVPLISGVLLAALGAVAFLSARAAERFLKSRLRPFHNEPYRRHTFSVDAEVIAPWNNVLDEFRDLAVEQSWPVDWETYYEAKQRFAEALKEGEFQEAVHRFAECIRHLAEAQKRRRKAELRHSV